MRTRSPVTDRTYDPNDMVFLVNPLQIARYMKHGATLYDLFENDDLLVAVFSKRETATMYQKWLRRELV